MLDAIQRTSDLRWPIIPRVVGGLPLAMFGLLHLVGATPVGPIAAAAGVPAPEVVGLLVPGVEVAAGLMLVFGWLTRVGGVLAAAAMAGAITVHLIIPDDRWPQPASGAPGPEPLGIFLLAWVILGCAVVSVIRGGGFWSLDRRQVASRASGRGGGLVGAPAPAPAKRVKPGKSDPVKDGESVW